MKPLLLLAGLLGAAAAFMRKTSPTPVRPLPQEPQEPQEPAPTIPDGPRFPPAPASPERSLLVTAYRRAAFSELPLEIRAGAPLRLTLPLHAIEFITSVDGRQWAYVLEVHENEARGKHKGVSVFVRK